MAEKKTIYLIDGSAYIYRAYHAIRGLSNSKGFPTNAIFGFTRMIMKLMGERLPEYVGMFFDAKGPTFRHKMYDSYKANRPPMPEDLSLQVPYIKDVTRAFNLPLFEMPGFEADDLIGTFAQKAENSGFSVIIVTGDKDFIQLVTDRITLWDPMKEKTIDRDYVDKSFGVQARMMIDVMGLSGDTADNIPGVPGIGIKTGLSLIQTFKSMDNLYRNIDQITKKKQHENLVTFKEQAILSRKLVTIDTDVSIDVDFEKLKAKPSDQTALLKLFEKFEFRQLQQLLSKKTDLSQKTYQSVQDEETFHKLIHNLKNTKIFAIDTETTSTDPMKAKIVGLSFSSKENEAFYIPCAHDYPEVPKQLDLDYVLENIKKLLEDPSIKKIGQNIKYDWIILSRYGIQMRGVDFDTMVASYLLNPSKRAHNLDQIALEFLNHKTITYKEVTGKGQKNFSQVSIEKALPYACEDADITFMVKNHLLPRLEEMGLEELFYQVEMPLVSVLKGMEMNGICVHAQRLMELSNSFKKKLETLENDIYRVAGEEFNIRSSQQLGQILFEKLALPVRKKTKKKTGYSTDVTVLQSLTDLHELPSLILRHRTLSKLKSTYTDALLELVNPDTNRIHTSFNQTVAATGRLSSSDPNLQNIPIRTEEGRKIRSTFIPQKGWHLVSADYSQIELRILAHCSDDAILIQSFIDDEDIHTRTATEVFQVFPSFITPELRRQAKIINFGIIYGMGAFSLSKELDISQKMAKTYIMNYFNRYSGVKQFTEKVIDQARKTGKTSTLLGRIRLLPDINSANRTMRLFSERTAVNTPIQGTAADLIKVAMINVDAALKKNDFKTHMLLSVHDELIFEVPPNELISVNQLIVNTMEGVWELKVPLKVNLAHGKNWAEAH